MRHEHALAVLAIPTAERLTKELVLCIFSPRHFPYFEESAEMLLLAVLQLQRMMKELVLRRYSPRRFALGRVMFFSHAFCHAFCVSDFLEAVAMAPSVVPTGRVLPSGRVLTN